jgi:hypothetical protein
MSKGNLKRHIEKACKNKPSVHREEEDTSNTIDTALEGLSSLQSFRESTLAIPFSGFRRSPHYAPSKEVVEKELPELVSWIKAPATFGKTRGIKRIGPYLDKLRTVFGKLKVFHKLTEKQLFRRLKSKRLSKKIFDMAALNNFMSTLHQAYNKEDDTLNLQTVHNYAVVLLGFLRWKLFGQNLKQLQPIVDAMTDMTTQISRLKKTDIDRQAKALKIQHLPQIPEILSYLNTELKQKAENVYQIYRDAKSLSDNDLWTIYSNYRNFILVAMLVGIPTQRAEVFNTIHVTSIKVRHRYTGLSIKDHKTAHKYGDVQVVLPPLYHDDFQRYLLLRKKITKGGCQNLFVNKKGEAEKRLTNIFKRLMYRKFQKCVTIRDCRSLYVTYMSKHLTLTQMYALSQQMFHSFQTQQEIYRSEDSFSKAVKCLIDTNSILQQLPLHEGPLIEEIEESPLQITPTETTTTEDDDYIYYHALDNIDELLVQRERTNNIAE